MLFVANNRFEREDEIIIGPAMNADLTALEMDHVLVSAVDEHHRASTYSVAVVIVDDTQAAVI